MAMSTLDTATSQTSGSADCPQVRLLLVEDLPVSQEYACAILRGAGHFVEVAEDGIEAIAAVKARSFDLILMDIEMPRMDGFTAARNIRGLPGSAGNTPIVAMTAVPIPKQIRAFREAGMDGYIAKPFQPQELLFAAVDTPALRLSRPY